MKLFPFILPLTGLVAAGPMFAGDQQTKDSILEMPSERSRWSMGASFAPLLNVESSFSGLGSSSAPFTPQPLGGGRNYEYEDGSVRVDASGNAGGLTGYWGYDNASQYDAAADSLSFNLNRSLSNGRAGETEEFSPGFEIFGSLEMGTFPGLSDRRISWGIKGGIHYAKISTGGSGSLTSDVLRVTDTFDTTGITLFPSPGYQGSFNGPGALIGDDPSRTVTLIENGATLRSDLDLDVDMITLAAGPYIKIPLAERFSVSAEAGVSVSIAHGDYEFDTLTTITGRPAQASSGNDTRTMVLPGLHAGVGAVWQLTEHFGLQGSARYQYIDSFSVDANGSNAALSFDGAAVVSLGGVWTF